MCSRLLLLLLLLSGCKQPTLEVETSYYNRHDLASYIIDTPDPKKEQPIFGQHLNISWNTKEKGPLELKIALVYRNGETEEKSIPLQQQSGSYIVKVVGQDYAVKGGILSYKVSLFANSQKIATSKNKLWVDQIKISD
jgi:hypothetical protein